MAINHVIRVLKLVIFTGKNTVTHVAPYIPFEPKQRRTQSPVPIDENERRLFRVLNSLPE